MPFRRGQPCLLPLSISTPALLTTLVAASLPARAEWFVMFATYDMSRVSIHSLPNTRMMHLPLRSSGGHGP